MTFAASPKARFGRPEAKRRLAYFSDRRDEIVERLSGRRTCEQCKAVFHVTERPSKGGAICDRCGGRLYQREDDRPESITVRLEAYERSTAPLIQFYRNLGVLTPVVAKGTPDEILGRTMKGLDRANDRVKTA